MENKLISMVDFVLEQVTLLKKQEINILVFRNRITNYANFLKQPLTLGMFVPCDLDGNILKEPQLITKQNSFDEIVEDYDYDECEVYKQAKERVIFNGFEIEKGELDRVTNGQIGLYPENHKTIEDLVKYNLTLTPNAIK